MTTVTMQEAQANLPEIISHLHAGEEIVIADQGRPLAAVKKARAKRLALRGGLLSEGQLWMAPDFNALLEEFREYME